VSRTFVYRQAHKARAALDEAFSPTTPETGVPFELSVTPAWLRQVIVALLPICRCSYRGVIEFIADLLGIRIGIGTVHQVLQSATQQAGVINHGQEMASPPRLAVSARIRNPEFFDSEPRQRSRPMAGMLMGNSVARE
jgi:hypothetical protein